MLYEFAMAIFTRLISACMVFVVLPLGISCLGMTLTADGSTHSPASLKCGSRAVFVCTMSAPPSHYLEFLVDGTSVSTCTTTCSTNGLPSHYSVTKNSAGTEYILTIDTLKHDDVKTFICQDDNGATSNSIDTTVEATFLEDMLTSQTTEAGSDVTSIITTNCLTSPSNVQVSISYKQELSTSAFEEYTSNRNIAPCTNTENPDCGGDTTSKIITTTNIPTKSGGDVYIFRLDITENNVLVYQRQLGRYGLEDDESSLTLAEILAIVYGALAGLLVCIIIIIICCWYYNERDNKRRHCDCCIWPCGCCIWPCGCDQCCPERNGYGGSPPKDNDDGDSKSSIQITPSNIRGQHNSNDGHQTTPSKGDRKKKKISNINHDNKVYTENDVENVPQENNGPPSERNSERVHSKPAEYYRHDDMTKNGSDAKRSTSPPDKHSRRKQRKSQQNNHDVELQKSQTTSM